MSLWPFVFGTRERMILVVLVVVLEFRAAVLENEDDDEDENEVTNQRFSARSGLLSLFGAKLPTSELQFFSKNFSKKQLT